MKDLWDRLEAHATKNGRSLRLRPGSSEEEIAAAEQVMGLAFPADFRASLLVHDGQEPGDGDAAPFEFLPGCDALAPVAAIAAQWKEEQEWAMASNGDHTPEILNTIKHPRRIPIAGTRWWDGDNTYLDLTPAAAGTLGQVIAFHTECDMTVLGPSFRGALENYLAALDAGVWSYDVDRKATRGPAPYNDGNRSWTFGEWVAASGRHHDAT
ncbi:MAG: SMI1/KNR4 family protein, partial [Polyangiales bacterium]